ncbi:hypothetical protein NFI96_018992 [Prochilodus magdalenae]|nr:hypothetical protein NFI96_018992 [Prochilodus magdalenae]
MRVHIFSQEQDSGCALYINTNNKDLSYRKANSDWLEIMNDRELDLTEAQKAIKAKYPAINKKYEYLDHTADVQLHSWGDSLEEAFEQCAMAMFGYMTDTETVEPLDTIEVESEGEDLESLLFHFLDDWLFKFSADLFFVPREVKVLHLDRMRFRIRSIGWGEEFNLSKHPQGTEVKAITYSAMQIRDDDKKPEILVIIDI